MISKVLVELPKLMRKNKPPHKMKEKNKRWEKVKRIRVVMVVRGNSGDNADNGGSNDGCKK